MLSALSCVFDLYLVYILYSLGENQELASLRDTNKNYCNAGWLAMFYLPIIIEALDHKGLFSLIFGLIF